MSLGVAMAAVLLLLTALTPAATAGQGAPDIRRDIREAAWSPTVAFLDRHLAAATSSTGSSRGGAARGLA